MQFAKDTFYVALSTRLAALNPARTVEVNGVTRPAVIVAENEIPTAAAPLADAFYLQWGKVREAEAWQRSPLPLLALDCTITYRTRGTSEAGDDRGRVLAALDMELRQICSPAVAPKYDYTVTPEVALGTAVLWDAPEFGEVEAIGLEMRRSVRLNVYFFPESAASAVRAPLAPVGRRIRAYFAPVNRTSGTPAIFDPAVHGAFDLDAPPAPWIDLGWVDNLKRTAGTRIQALRSGVRGAATGQVRVQSDARIELDFFDWGKLQMALAAGSQHMNVLVCDPGATPGISGGAPLAGVALESGSTATELVIENAAQQFAPGDLVAVDADYAGQTGYVGHGIAAAYVRQSSDVRSDADYIRRVTFNVARISAINGNVVTLSSPLPGGTPPANSKAQKVAAFADREGGSFFQEWSALFVVAEESGGRLCFYYPRLQPAAPAQESFTGVAGPLAAAALHAAFIALPFTDVNDSEPVLCCRSYFPPAGTAVY